MFEKNLLLYRINIPWFHPVGQLLLAVPLVKRPPARERGQAVEWEQKIKESLTELQKSIEFNEVWGTQELRQLISHDSGEGGCKETIKWDGWQHLVLPTGFTFGLDGEWPIPMSPNRNPMEWPHDLWGLKVILSALETGGSVLQFHPNGLATAGYLTALLSAMADTQVHPHKILYPVRHLGLGLNSFHYGILLGMDQSAWGRWR